MTQFSWNWACSPQVGDAGPLTVENLMIARMLMGNARPDAAGTVYWKDATPLADLGLTNPSDGLLEPTNPAGDIVRIASGIGMVQGWLYANDDDVDFDVSGGNANATDLIVLQRGDPAAALAVRLAHLRGPVGGAATVTQSSLLWEVPIAEVLLDGSGNFSALTDVRQLVNTPLGTLALIGEFISTGAESACTFSAIPPFFRQLVLKGTVRAGSPGSTTSLVLTLNGDTGTNYDRSTVVAQGGAVAHTQSVGIANVPLGNVSAAAAAAGVVDQLEAWLSHYTSAMHKTVQGRLSRTGDGTTGSSGLASYASDGWWRDTSPVTEVELTLGSGGNFAVGTRIALYGVI